LEALEALEALEERINISDPALSKKKQAVKMMNYKKDDGVYSPEITMSTNIAPSIVRPVTGKCLGRNETVPQPLAEEYEGASAGSIAITRRVAEISAHNVQSNMSYVTA
jgi:hypothetical protein